MKKLLSFLLIITLSIVLVTGCGNNNSQYAGTYQLEYSKYVGDSDNDKNTSETAEILLKEDGTGKSNRNGYSYDVEWSIKGNSITLIEKYYGMTIEYNGTLIDNKLDLFNGDKTDSLTYETVYIKK